MNVLNEKKILLRKIKKIYILLLSMHWSSRFYVTVLCVNIFKSIQLFNIIPHLLILIILFQ